MKHKWIVLIGISFAMPAWAASHDVVVKLRAGPSVTRAQDQIVRTLQGTEFTVKRRYQRIPYIAMTCSDEALSRLALSPEVLDIAPDVMFLPVLSESIPKIGADKAHAQGFMGQGYTVAILDTGIESGHEAFGNRVKEEACFTNGPQCPNGADTDIGPGSARPCLHQTCYHGTHVAGIAAGASNQAGVGVAPRADIVAIQVFTVTAGGGLGAFFSDIVAAIEHVATLAEGGMKIASINMSLGTNAIVGDCTDQFLALSDVSKLAMSHGVGVVAASGNNGSSTGVSSPGCVKVIVATGCTSKTDGICSFSNRGPEMEIWAPGLSIRSAGLGGSTRSASGTSMSAPHVAGAYALVRSMFPTIGPPDNVRTMLKFFGDQIQGKPRLRLDNLGAPPPPDPNTPQPPDPNEPSPTCADADNDGEQDSRDRCPGTPAGTPIDDAGCSHQQWCHTIVPDTWRNKGECRNSDFGNDEPLRARDCRVERNGWGQRDDECVPR